MNTKIRSQFETGRLSDVILGKPPFFQMDPTWRDHDTLLVLGELIEWANETGRVAEAGGALLDAARALLDEGQALSALRTIWTYVTVTRTRSHQNAARLSDENPLLVDLGKLAEVVLQASHQIGDDEESRTLLAFVTAALGCTLG